jgi:hypothetical protein
MSLVLIDWWDGLRTVASGTRAESGDRALPKKIIDGDMGDCICCRQMLSFQSKCDPFHSEVLCI